MDGSLPAVYKSDKAVRVLTGQQASLTIGFPPNNTLGLVSVVLALPHPECVMADRKLKVAFVGFSVLINICPICNTEMFIVVRVKISIFPSTDNRFIIFMSHLFIDTQYFLLWGYN